MAVVTPSWGGPSRFPRLFELGLKVLERDLGLVVREMPHARADADWVAEHPEARASDLTSALEDPSVRAIWCSIGGDDAMRLLPLLDPALPSSHPKALIGFSDSTVLLTWFRLQGVVAFHGPSVLAGMAQWATLPSSFHEQLRSVLFAPAPTHEYRGFAAYSEGYPDWGIAETVGHRHPDRSSPPWHWANGASPASGELFGGCLEVLEFLKGTPYFPPVEFFDGKLLFLETSEEKPSPKAVVRVVRNYGLSGVLGRISGLLFGRYRGYTESETVELDRALGRVARDEFHLPDLPVVTHLDFGHTDPQWVLPLGVRARIDPDGPSFRLLEPAVS